MTILVRKTSKIYLVVEGSNPGLTQHKLKPAKAGLNLWRTQRDSNLQSPASEADALSSCAMGAYRLYYIILCEFSTIDCVFFRLERILSNFFAS